jgi:hypothetical protein
MSARPTLTLPTDVTPPTKRKPVSRMTLRAYVDRGWRRDDSLRVKDPLPVPRTMLTMAAFQQALRRHNALQPVLQGTHRILLRWGESGGNGMPNPEADIRETHYDPLPPDLQRKVDDIVAGSPWETLARKWYRTSLTVKELAADLCVSRKQLYIDWGASLWYYRGRFEAEAVHE